MTIERRATRCKEGGPAVRRPLTTIYLGEGTR